MNNFIDETYICMLDQVFPAQKVVFLQYVSFLIKDFHGLFYKDSSGLKVELLHITFLKIFIS